MKILKNTPYGQISFCACKNIYHLEFGNIFVDLTDTELKEFKNYVSGTDYKFYLQLNSKAKNIRKLMLNVGSRNIYMSLHEHEFLELKNLLSFENISMAGINTYNVNINNFKINLN
jgi:hypothetical protein